MLKDATLVLADAATGTTSAASTSYIDSGAAGDAYAGCWFVVRVDTAFTAGAGAPTAQFQLQTASSTDFYSDAATLNQSATFVAASLTADTIMYKARIPFGAQRYLRAYKVVDSGADAKRFSAGTWDAFIVMDLGKDINGLES